MLEERVAQLEKQARFFRIVCCFLVLTCVLSVSLGAKLQNSPAPIETTELKLVDKQGNQRALLTVSKSGAANFVLQDEKGTYAQLVSTTTGGMFWLKGTRTKSGDIILRFMDGAPDAYLRPADDTKEPVIQLSLIHI